MVRRLVVQPQSDLDIQAAAVWYEDQRFGLGSRFFDELDLVFQRIKDNPQQFPCVEGDVHRALPFATFLTACTSSGRMLKKSSSGVLASLRGSTFRGEPLGCRNCWRGFSVRQESFNGRTVHTKCGTYLLASSFAAALPDGLFEHPALGFPVVLDLQASEALACLQSFSTVC